MHPNKLRRPKPTLQAAHNSHKTGGGLLFDPLTHYMTNAERKAEIEVISQELRQVVRKFPRTQNLEYAILKAHLIIEYAITQFIVGHSPTAINVGELPNSFRAKLDIAVILGFGIHSPTLTPTVEGLNKTRNQIAHRFEFDLDKLDEILRINSDDYDGFRIKDDRERIRYLRWICSFVCGVVAGELQGEFAMVQALRESSAVREAKCDALI